MPSTALADRGQKIELSGESRKIYNPTGDEPTTAKIANFFGWTSVVNASHTDGTIERTRQTLLKNYQ